MTGLYGLTAFLSPLPLTLPILLVAGVAIGWWVWNRSANPPQFRGYAVRIGWMVDPIAWLDRDLRNGALTSGISAVLRELLHELVDGHHLTNSDIYGVFPRPRVREDPLLRRARRAVRQLEVARHLAELAEDPGRSDLWSRWRRPVRRSRARRILDHELGEIREIWPQMEAAR